jgi:GNAT superfamily N-acetyltransferase
LVKEVQGQGIGRAVYNLVENDCAKKWGIQSIRLGISDDNDVSSFWRKLGFESNGHTYDFQAVNRVTHVVEYEKNAGKCPTFCCARTRRYDIVMII